MTQKKPGRTETTSVSVSKEFRELTREYKFSPTEVYRRGVSVMLADLGVRPFDNELNKDRVRESKKVLKEIMEVVNMRHKLKEALRALEILDKI